ncbi:mechanosensitive ion channel family protein [Novisyntrophococcus fermenticellae]|uniref:mechanosensitive ion channel family protein n=1 Tax=Novisyntrophococcus fermenticellae TaxID=2068655 RepID=UPI001E4FDA80|nr:mechanosensitive ion channel domain-containing protein [Novisyntrophococcus fermenticellae]
MITWEAFQEWMGKTGVNVLLFLGKVLIAVVVYFIISKVIKKICKVLKRNMERFHVEPSAASFVVSLLRYTVLGLTIVTIIVQLDIVAESSITALLASAGVAISLALQGGLSNFAGGILILFLKPFKAGDYVICQVDNVEGTVKKIELYYTTILTADNKVTMIPNSRLTNNTITNVTALDKRKLEIKVRVSYESDIRKTKQLLQKLVETDGRFLEEDRLFYVDELSDSAVVVGLQGWVNTGDYMRLRWDMLERIKLTMEEEGIRIPHGMDIQVQP